MTISDSAIMASNAYCVDYKQENDQGGDLASPDSYSVALLAKYYRDSDEKAELKGLIACFLNDYMNKSRRKAERIVARLPESTTVEQLRNIYDALNIIKMDKGALLHLKNNLSWKQAYMSTLRGIDDAGFGDTTKEQRLKLRALILYLLAGVDPSLYKYNLERYNFFQDEMLGCGDFLRKRDIKSISEFLYRAVSEKIIPGSIQDVDARLLPVVIEEYNSAFKV